jgi:RES domain-containing protein
MLPDRFRPHPEFPRIVSALSRIPTRAWSGVAYRSVVPAYAGSRDLLSGEGVRRHGGRWNPPSAFAAVYASLTPETALAEVLSRFRDYGIPVADAMPRVLAAVEVSVASLADLTTPGARRSLRVSRRRMRREDWRRATDDGREALTQAIGRAAFERGLEGLLVFSAPDPAGRNLVLFPTRLGTASRLRARVPEKSRAS